MLQLLYIEWLKIKRLRTFYILLGIFFIMLPLWNYSIANGFMKLTGNINLLEMPYHFSNVWQMISYWGSIFLIFPAMALTINITNEYRFRTARQNVIEGWTRMQFYHAKWIVVILLSLISTVWVFLTGMVFGFSYGSAAGFPGTIEYLFYFWILSLNYYGFLLLLSLLLRRSGMTLGMFFLYAAFLEPLLQKLINWQTQSQAGNFLPLQSSDELIPFPLPQMVKSAMQIPESSQTGWLLLASAGWILLYYLIGKQRLVKSDW